MKYLRIICSGILPAFLLTMSWPEVSGRETADSDRIVTAFNELRDNAEKGDPEALYKLSRFYERGWDSIPADSMKASALLLQSATAGYPAAQNLYGFRLYNGIGMTADRAAGLEWMEKAAVSGDLTAANNLGWLLLEGDSIQHDCADAAFWLERAAGGGMPQAMSMLADLYRDGRGVPADTVRARDLYDKAIRLGLEDAQLKLLDMERQRWKGLSDDEAVALGLGYYPSPAPFLGVFLFEQAAANGSPKAHALLGDAMTRALGASYSHDLSLMHYFLAARGGNPSAQFILGELLEIFPDALLTLKEMDPELLISPDENSGRYWLGLAADAGINDAATAMLRLLEK